MSNRNLFLVSWPLLKTVVVFLYLACGCASSEPKIIKPPDSPRKEATTQPSEPLEETSIIDSYRILDEVVIAKMEAAKVLARRPITLPNLNDDELPSLNSGKVQYMDRFVGSKAARERLLKERFVVTEQQFYQIFSAYIAEDPEDYLPKFITCDSAWHTFFILLKEAITQLEQKQATVLKTFSETLYRTAVDAAAKDNDDDYRDIALYAAVGLALQDKLAISQLPEKDRAKVGSIVRSLKEGNYPVKVLFFGLPLQPNQFRPTGIYSGSASLSSYFAARRWYQLTDFRLTSSDETRRAIKLSKLINSDEQLMEIHKTLLNPYIKLLGLPDDPSVDDYIRIANDVKWNPGQPLDSIVQAASNLPAPRVNDQLFMDRKSYMEWRESARGFRLLPPFRLPSAEVFQTTTDPELSGRMFPSGLDFLAAAPFKSPEAAQALLIEGESEATVEQIEMKEGEATDSIHGRALGLLSSLGSPPPRKAPALFKRSTWKYKQLGTILGGWAEMRHLWSLQAKLNIEWMGLTEEPAGYVSPYPGFFLALGTLAGDVTKILQSQSEDRAVFLSRLADLKTSLELYEKYKGKDLKEVPKENRDELSTLNMHFNFLPSNTDEILRFIQDRWDHWQSGGEISSNDRKLVDDFGGGRPDLPVLFKDFAALCNKLAAIADKQLKNKALSADDENFVREYGSALGRLHFYEGNSWLTPRDDFSLITPVFSNPMLNETLYTGLARPEALYVIIEHKGKPTLHRGAVLSYREFSESSAEQMDNFSWQEKIRNGDSKQPPRFSAYYREVVIPEEVARIIESGGIYPSVDSVPGEVITRSMILRLHRGGSENTNWLIDNLCPRLDDKTIGDAVGLIVKIAPSEVGELATCLAPLPIKDHLEKLVGLLDSGQVQYADSAAYLLAEHQKNVDVKLLLRGYDSSSDRAKRLRLYVLGHIDKPGEIGKKVLVDALRGDNQALRYEAINAVEQGKHKKNALIEELFNALEAENCAIAGAAARALGKLGVKRAGAPILARFEKMLKVSDIDAKWRRDSGSVADSARYSGYTAIMVLSNWKRPTSNRFETWFLEALGNLDYKESAPTILSLLDVEIRDDAAAALKKIVPDDLENQLIKTALDTTRTPYSRSRSLYYLSKYGEEDTARKLVPLLSDRTVVDESSNLEERPDWLMRDEAAETIVKLLNWPEEMDTYCDQAQRDKVHKKLKQWVLDE